MPIRIRRVDLEADRSELIDLLRRNLQIPSEVGAARYDWLYRSGPHGSASAWKAEDDSNGKVIGTCAAFPRIMFLGGRDIKGFVLGDFCIEHAYRSMGPSLQLQRACLGVLEESGYSFVYDFPSSSMTAVYRRLGIEGSNSFVRWALPLRVEERLAKRVRPRWLAESLAAPINTVLALRGNGGVKTGTELEILEGSFGSDFSDLNRQVRGKRGMQTSRTAEYLNWRYRSNPLLRYECMTARKAGKLEGYAIYNTSGGSGSIADLCSADDSETVVSLLSGAARRLRVLGAQTVSLVAAAGHPWSGLFENAGFRRRETSTVVVKAAPGAQVSLEDFLNGWYAMSGERDS